MATEKEKARTGEENPSGTGKVKGRGLLVSFCFCSFSFGDLKSASFTSKLSPNELMRVFLLLGCRTPRTHSDGRIKIN